MSFTNKVRNELCNNKDINLQFVAGEFFALQKYFIEKEKISELIKKRLEFYNENFELSYEKVLGMQKKSKFKRGYLSGVFICCGIINDPSKNYNLEFVNDKIENVEYLKKILDEFHINSKLAKRKSYYINYVRESDSISKFLSIAGASVSLMEFENIRILKELRNNINRSVNFEAANLNKTIVASVDRSNDIEYIVSNAGINYLPEELRQIAIYRIKYRQASLKELGEKFTPPISKSSVYNRLKKISEIANQLRNKKGEKE